MTMITRQKQRAAKWLKVLYVFNNRVAKIVTAPDFTCGKSRDFPKWEIPPKLGNTGKYFIKKIYFDIFKLYRFYYVTVPFICDL